MIRCIPALALMLAAGSAAAQESATYSYDVHGRLIGVARSSGADTAYAYDDADNRTAKETTGASALLQQETSGGDNGSAASEDAAPRDRQQIETTSESESENKTPER